MDDRTLSALARARSPDTAGRLAIVTPGARLTFAELGERVAAALGGLRVRHVARGVRVSLVADASLEVVVALHALLEARAVIVPIHPRLTDVESRGLRSSARVDLHLDRDVVERLASPRASAPPIDPIEPAPGDADDPGAIVFTSGTSGAPKGAVLSRGAMIASARASSENLGDIEGDAWLCCMPLAHVGGLSLVTRAALSARPLVIDRGFDPDAVLLRASRGEASLLSVVPTMLHALLERDADGALARLRVVLVGGAPASSALLDACAARRIHALTTYGLTEACSQVTTQAPRDPASRERGSGAPLRGTEVRVHDDAGAALGAGAVGRIAVRGPTLMLGYDRGPGALDRARDAEGWFETGDLGELDERGRLHVHARRTDLVITGGENVYPAEVEQALESTGGVRRALVFGVPDARWGQIVAAAVELHPGARVGDALDAAHARLAPHKHVRRVAVVPAIALTPSGKIDCASAKARYEPSLVHVER